MTTERVRNIAAPVIILAIFLGLWQAGFFNAVFSVEEFAIPRPSSIVTAAAEGSTALWGAFSETGRAVILGWMLGNALGFGLALLLLTLPPDLMRRLGGFFGSFQALPVVAIAPIVALWMGSSMWFKVGTVVVMVFPQMLTYALRGFNAVDPTVLELAKSYDTSGWQVFRLFRLPLALSFVFTSLRYSVVLALIGVVVCEILRSADGLGYHIHDALQAFNAPEAWAAVVILALLGVISYSSLLLIERLLTPWAFRR